MNLNILEDTTCRSFSITTRQNNNIYPIVVVRDFSIKYSELMFNRIKKYCKKTTNEIFQIDDIHLLYLLIQSNFIERFESKLDDLNKLYENGKALRLLVSNFTDYFVSRNRYYFSIPHVISRGICKGFNEAEKLYLSGKNND